MVAATDLTQYLDRSIRFLKGVGPHREKIFKKIGVATVRDLLFYFPRTHEDRSTFKPISKLVLGETVSLKGQVVKKRLKRLRAMTIFEMDVVNPTGLITATWFNQPYLDKTFNVKDSVILSGKVEFYKRLQLSSPEYEILNGEEDETIHTGRIVPIYPLTDGLSQKTLRTLIFRLLQEVKDELEDYLPGSVRQRYQLETLKQAVLNYHFPTSQFEISVSRKRLVFDDFFILQFMLAQSKKKRQAEKSCFQLSPSDSILKPFFKALPYEFTASQEQACQEILKDLSLSHPMNRLLQGDVGSGKTAVAAFGIWLAFSSGFQSALLVPTEILAEQHYRNLALLFSNLKLPVFLLTGTSDAKKRKKILEELKKGNPCCVVGSHSLLQLDVQFKKLGMVVIDEQHKFGVHQRAKLLTQTSAPHVLVMTATPIPRTLTLAFYGDLSISTLREFPRGPKQIKTWWVTRQKEPQVFRFISDRVEKKEQAFIVFPAIEENEKTEILAAKKMYQELSQTYFQKINVGLIHGKLKKEEKDRVMAEYRSGHIQVLVATSVIEVGIDTPASSVIVIENADRFGLSQLHQLRGRVGRQGQEGYCFLIADPKTEEGKKRLRILTKHLDGFLIAEEDLKLRGPGDMLGVRQSGIPFFNVANILEDSAILNYARDFAFECIATSQSLNWLNHPLLKPRWIQIQSILQ
jgi:ATP-dependent DNA helicase RecG